MPRWPRMHGSWLVLVQNTRQARLEMKPEPVSNLLKRLSVSTTVLLPVKDTEAMLLLRGR